MQKLVMPRLGEALGQTIVHVPYKSIAPAVTDVIGGHIRTGRVRLLAMTANWYGIKPE